MKNLKFDKVSKIVLATMFMIGLFGSLAVFAASTPSLGTASTFGILSSTFTRNIGVTVITGDLGYTTLSGGATQTVSGATHVADSAYNTAGTDQGVALADLNTQACTYTFPGGAVDLATDTTHGPIGVYTPGVYCNAPTSASSIGTSGITLDGAGTYIFRVKGALTSVNNSSVRLLNGASSCDVFWTPLEATTLGSDTTFVGTIIDAAGITVGYNTSWNGRALAFGGTVTTDTNLITSTCTTNNPILSLVILTPTIPFVPFVSSSYTSGVTYGCKDPNAINYNNFSASNPDLCVYKNTPVITPLFPKTGFSPKENISWYKSIINFILK